MEANTGVLRIATPHSKSPDQDPTPSGRERPWTANSARRDSGLGAARRTERTQGDFAGIERMLPSLVPYARGIDS